MKKPHIMGIVNVAPNSFYDKSRLPTKDQAIDAGMQMIEEGADSLDIGGVPSSHFREGYQGQGAQDVSLQEELDRVVPVVEELSKHVQISVDTCRAQVAQAVIDAGASIINDITGLRDPKMLDVVKKSGVKCVIMHMRGTPETMQQDTDYSQGVVSEVHEWLQEQIRLLPQDQVIADPGFCFGKSVEDNYALLHNLEKFSALGPPLLVGMSRKSMMERVLGKKAPELLPPTIALNVIAWQKGASIFRVHDVAAHVDAFKVLTLEQSQIAH